MNKSFLCSLLMISSLASCASTVPSPDSPLSGLLAVAAEREKCVRVFEDRLTPALGSARIRGEGKTLARQVLVQLPRVERLLIGRATAPDNFGSTESDIEVLSQLRQAFADANICGRDDHSLFDLDFFADQLNFHLSSMGIDTRKEFETKSRTEFDSRSLVLLALVDAAKEVEALP